MADSKDYFELQVRITMLNDVQMDAIIFPLPSHRHDPPAETLAGFINQRRGEFFLVRMQDGSQLLLPLSQCAMFDLSYQTEEMMRAIDPDIRESWPTSNPNSVTCYSPVVVTLLTNRIARGDLWYFDFDPQEECNVMAALNRETRYLCLHGERATHFIRRDAILKVQLQGDAMKSTTSTSHPKHVTRTVGLVEAPKVAGGAVHPLIMPGAPARPPHAAEPRSAPTPAPQEFPFMPGSASREIRRPDVGPPAPPPDSNVAQQPEEEQGPQGVDERFWY